MGDFGLGALALGSGAGNYLQQALKQRLLEREMALQEQSQRASEQQHAAELGQRQQELGETRDMNAYFRGEGVRQADQRLMQDSADNLKGTYTKGQVVGDPQAALFRATGMGHLAQPTPMDMPESATNLPGDQFMGATFAGLPEKPSPESQTLYPLNKGGQKIYGSREDAVSGKFPAWQDPKTPTGGAGGVQLTSEALDMAATVYAKTGQVLGLGMGAANDKKMIVNRAAELYPGRDVAGSGAEYKSDLASLTQLTKRIGAIKPYAAQASLSLENVRKASQTVPRTGSPLVNRYKNWVSNNLMGQAPLSQFEVYAYNAARDYARVTAGGAESIAQMTDAAASTADALLNTAQNPDQINAVIDAMKNDMANTTTTLEQQLESTRSKISQKPGTAPTQNTSSGKTVTLAQIQAVAQKNGTTVEQEKQRAQTEGYVIR